MVLVQDARDRRRLLTIVTTSAVAYLLASPWCLRWALATDDFGECVRAAGLLGLLAAAPLVAAIAELAHAASSSTPWIFGHRAVIWSLGLAVLAVAAIELT
jgi:hypothetical protein